MKKSNKSYAIGWVVLLATIVAAVALGQMKKPTAVVPDYNTGAYARFVSDTADVLSDQQEETICRYNAAWDAKYGVTVAFLAPATDFEDLEGYAYTWGDAAGLDERDAVLIYNAVQDSYYVAPGEEFRNALTVSAQGKLASALDNTAVPFGQAAVDFYGVMDGVLSNAFGTWQNGYAAGGSYATTIVMLISFLVILFLILWAVESARFSTYRARYYGVVTPPVVYRPVFFWHRPGSRWYRRNWRPVPPPPAGGYGGGPRRPSSGGGFGGSRTGSSSGGFHRPSSGGGFGGTRSGGTRSSGSRSSFGGSRSSGRSGGFGGSRGGGFGGRR